MRGVKAKALRKISEGVFDKDRKYVASMVPSHRYGMSLRVRLVADCTRSMYKHLKSAYKKRAP